MTDMPIWLALAAVTLGPAPDGAVFSIDSLAQKLEESERAYLPFLAIPTLRAGLYTVPAGGTDMQQPYAKSTTCSRAAPA